MLMIFAFSAGLKVDFVQGRQMALTGHSQNLVANNKTLDSLMIIADSFN
jgi:hypothetical protein